MRQTSPRRTAGRRSSSFTRRLPIWPRRIGRRSLSSTCRSSICALDLVVGVVIASLLVTEPSLPARTTIAFGVMLAIAAAWAVFFGWTLTRRTLFPAWHRVVAARLAVAFTSVFTVGALALALLAPDVRQTSLAASAAGGIMLAVAVAILIRALSHHRALIARKEQLERKIAG